MSRSSRACRVRELASRAAGIVRQERGVDGYEYMPSKNSARELICFGQNASQLDRQGRALPCDRAAATTAMHRLSIVPVVYDLYLMKRL